VADLSQAEFLQQRRQVHAEPAAIAVAQQYQPPTGLSADRPQASTAPSAAGFFSSAAPSGTQSPCSFSQACRSLMARSRYFSVVEPTWQTSVGGSACSSVYMV
jgi:hypothetical protein